MNIIKNVGCFNSSQTTVHVTHQNRFWVWQGIDNQHPDFTTQIRLEDDGTVYISTQDGHISTLQSTNLTAAQFHQLIKSAIESNV